MSVKIDKSLRLCTEKATGDQYAVKIVSKRHRPMREVSILQLCQGHPNIVTLHEVLNDEVMYINLCEVINNEVIYINICEVINDELMSLSMMRYVNVYYTSSFMM